MYLGAPQGHDPLPRAEGGALPDLRDRELGALGVHLIIVFVGVYVLCIGVPDGGSTVRDA